MQFALNHHLLVGDHVVAQIVKAQLVVGAVGHVGGIRLAAFVIVQAMDDQADRQAQVAVDLAHPFAVAGGQVIVDRDDMNAAASQGIQVDRQGRDQGFAFTSLHFGDSTLMQDNAANQLNPIVVVPDYPSRCFTDGRKGIRQNVVKGLAACQSRL